MRKASTLFCILLSFLIAKGQNPVLNPSFESWDSITAPTWWGYASASSGIMQSTQSHSGMYAAKGTVNGHNIVDLGSDAFQISQNYSCLNFAYIFSPVNGAVLYVEIQPWYADFNPAGSGSLYITNAASQYTTASVPITYTTGAQYCWIHFYIVSGDGSTPPGVGSYFIIDDVSLTNSCSVSGVSDLIPTDFSISPNPTSSWINVHLNTSAQENSVMEIYDVLGRLMKTQQLSAIDSQIDVNDLPQGIYSIVIRHGNAIETNKLEIIR